jgi:pantothenate kinase
MLVNIGSGVSILKVTGDSEYSRISGSSLGGGTFWGLSRLLTGVSSFDEILQLSAKGNNRSVSTPPPSSTPNGESLAVSL